MSQVTAEKKREYNQTYYAQSADKCKQSARKYYLEHKEEILAKRREYYKNTRETRLKQFSEWRERNPTYAKEKLTCECGCVYTRGHKNRHMNSKLHETRMNAL